MKMQVSAKVIAKNGEIRSKIFVEEFDDKTLKSGEATANHAKELIEKRYGPEARLTSVTRW